MTQGMTPSTSPQRRLLELLALERDEVGIAVVYAAAVSLLSIVTPLGVQFLVNTVAFGALLQPLVVLTLLVLTGLTFAATLRALHAWAVERLQQRLFARAALSIAERLPRVEATALDGRHGPEIVNRFFDVVTIQKGAATLLVDGVTILLQTVVGLLLLAFYHPMLLAFDVVLVASLAIIVLVLGRKGPATALQESKKKYALASWLQEVVRAPHAFKSLAGERLARERAAELTRAYLDARRTHFKVLFRQVCGALALQAIASAALLGVGGWLVINNQLTLGQLVAAELIVSAVVLGVAKAGKLFESYYDVLAAADKVGQVMDLPLERPAAVPAEASAIGAAIEARGAGLSYADGSACLRGVSLRVTSGDRVVALREGGGGAGLFADLLGGARLPEEGQLDLDGVDARDLDLASFRERVAILRGGELFAGTIADNVLFGAGGATRHDARRALEATGAWSAVMAVPEGLDARVGAGGGGLGPELSAKILVARALLAGPRLLVLDGLLDDVSERARRRILNAIDELAPSATVVITTGVRSLTDWADKVVAVRGDRAAELVASGSSGEVIR